MTYISMFVLQLIDDGATQKELCDTLYLSLYLETSESAFFRK